jgi:N6-L-threonylcarbamoyladenine synthase
MLESRDHNFSFSGLKTAVRYLLPKLKGEFIDDVCASFQRAVVDVLVKKTIRAARECQSRLVTVSGGVSCNRELRDRLRAACESAGFSFRSANSPLCTDNAAMIALVASLKLRAGMTSSVSDEIDPNLALIKE